MNYIVAKCTYLSSNDDDGFFPRCYNVRIDVPINTKANKGALWKVRYMEKGLIGIPGCTYDLYSTYNPKNDIRYNYVSSLTICRENWWWEK